MNKNKIIMEKIDDEPIQYRIQCKFCFSFLSNPFEYNYDPNKIDEQIKIDRYKGDNINYHSINEYNQKGNIFYSFIFCLKCGQKVGYWVSQASKRDINNINKLFFFFYFINMIKYNKNEVTKEEDRKFKQEDIFYNSDFLTKDIIDYAKEHIDNFIENVKKFEFERNDADFCYKSFDKRIIALKNLFIRNVKDRNNAYHLGIDFSKEEINTKKRIRTSNENNNIEEIQIEEDYDNKSNGKKNLNIIQDNNINNNINNNIEEVNLNENNNVNENGGGVGETINSNKNFSGSDIYLDDKKSNKINSIEISNNTKNNNKEPSNNSKINNKKQNKNKNKRKRK